MADSQLKIFDYDKAEIGEELGSYEYILTQEMLDAFRSSVDDPEAQFPTLGVKHDATAFAMVYDDPIGTVNAGNQVEFFNPPIVGKKINVTGRIADKYLRRDKPYIVIEATAIDEDGRMLEKLSTYQLPFEHAWVLKLVQAAVLAACESLQVKLTGSENSFRFVGQSRWTQDLVTAALFSADSAQDMALVPLAAAVRNRGRSGVDRTGCH